MTKPIPSGMLNWMRFAPSKIWILKQSHAYKWIWLDKCKAEYFHCYLDLDINEKKNKIIYYVHVPLYLLPYEMISPF